MNDNLSPVREFIRLLDRLPYSELITTQWEKPEKQASLSDFPESLSPVLINFLHHEGLEQLYEHQALCFNEAALRRNIIISSGTSSGKTLCYNLPVFNCLLQEPGSTALYLFPTKALTEDQFKKIQAFNQFLSPSHPSSIKPGIYDGDTQSSKRITIRNTSNIILTNPDMIHLGILPHHTAWADFLTHLRFIVLDEVHVYRGVFGSHVANVLRRLKRLLKFYGAAP